jgi:multiple sugar transport system substrate-binding protein
MPTLWTRTWLLLIGLLVLLLGACTPPPPVEPAAPANAPAASTGDSAAPAASTGDELNVWITWGDNPAQIQSLFDRYTDETGIKVTVNAPVDDPKVIAGLSGSEPPDLLILGSPENIGSWTREGLVTPLDDFLQTGKIDMEDMSDGAEGQCVYQGQYYCLPWGTDTYALFWNKDLFEEAGLDPDTPPQTMEELAEFAKQLTITDDNGNITQVGFIPDFPWSHLEHYVTMMGGYWYNEDGTQLQLTSEPVVNALTWEQQFYCDYDVEEIVRFSSSFGAYMSPDNGFYAGKIAMQFDGEWQPGPNFIQAFKPELFYEVVPFPPPAANPERANTSLVTGSIAMIPSGVEDKDAAFELLAWIMTPEILGEQMVANFNLPTSAKAAEDPRFTENENFQVFINLMNDPNAKSPVVTPINAEVTAAIGQIEEQVLRNCADPLPLLEEAQATLQPQLDAALEN